MRIGLFTSIGGWGGSEIYLKTIMLSLRESGHEPVLIGVQGSRLFAELESEGVECVAWRKSNDSAQMATPEGNPIQGARQADGKARVVKQTILSLLPGWLKLIAGSFREVCRLRRVIGLLHLDVLQVNVHGYEVAGWAGRWAKVKTVGFYHTSPVRESAASRRWLMKWSAAAYDCLCFPSRYALSAWAAALQKSQHLCRVVPHGVEMSRFLGVVPRCRKINEPFRLVSVGRLHPMKGYACLIEALAALEDPRVTLDILGEGSEYDVLRKQIMDADLQARVNLHGHVEHPEMFLAAADAFVLLSQSHESFGLAVVEAMLSGLPVITSDFGPFPEINQSGVTGFVVPVGGVSAACRAVRDLAGNPDLCRSMGEKARAHARQLYDKQRMVEDMVELFCCLVESRHRVAVEQK